MLEYYFRAICCRLGVAPSEFWKMTPNEAAIYIDENTPEEIAKSERISERIDKRRAQLLAKGVKVL